MKRSGVSYLPAVAPKLASVMAALGLSLFVVDCLDTRSDVSGVDAGIDAGSEPGPLVASITVDVSDAVAVVAPFHFGMHASVYDNALHHPELPSLLEESGVSLLRWPGGGYSDNYHWSNHSMTPWPADPDVDPETDPQNPRSRPDPGYLAPRSDFGSFVGMVDRVGTAVMITVNYGSNLQGDGPGEPKEAAAWVAYANGDPDDPHEIGIDGAGNDWLTVGYWASLRASEPEPEDDGRNFLRIGRPEPLDIEYWEIGNEVFGNGFHENNGFLGIEFDLHVPYRMRGDDPEDPRFIRYARHELSGTTYGEGVLAYVAAMKAVDPDIKVGAVLGTPPDDSWITRVPKYNWNEDVLRECGRSIDFVIVHWYPQPRGIPNAEPDDVDNVLFRVDGLLTFPRSKVAVMASTLRDSIAEYAGDNAENVEIMMTEVGPGPGLEIPRRRNGLDRGQALGIFAADTLVTAAEHGIVNVDWLELHNGTFLGESDHEVETPRGPAFSGIRLARLLSGPGDRLVAARSDQPALVVHASAREDGRIGVLLLNTQAPELLPATVTVDLGGAAVASTGERYDYWPVTNVPTDGGVPEAGAPDAGVRPNASSGPVIGPEAFSDMASPFTIEIPPYGVTLVLFDPP